MADTDTNTHGSRTEDEMVARLRDAGYADWEIAEEMDLKAWAEKTAAAHTRAFATEGRLKHIEPNRIDTQEKEPHFMRPRGAVSLNRNRGLEKPSSALTTCATCLHQQAMAWRALNS